MVRRTLFCRRCNFNRWVSAANSQAVNTMKLKLKLIYDRQSVGQSVLVSGIHPGPSNNFSFSLKFLLDRRGWACNLLYNSFWALAEQSLLGWSPAELTAIFYRLIWDSPNLEGQIPVFIYPRNRVAQLYPRALGSLFVASYDSKGYGGGTVARLHTGATDGLNLSCLQHLGTDPVENTIPLLQWNCCHWNMIVCGAVTIYFLISDHCLATGLHATISILYYNDGLCHKTYNLFITLGIASDTVHIPSTLFHIKLN
jgi:hypothetical protein